MQNKHSEHGLRSGQGETHRPSHSPEAHGAGGHAHKGHSSDQFRRRFWISLVLTLPVLIYSYHIQMWFRFTAPPFPGSSALPPVLATIIFFYGGTVFLKGAWRELSSRSPGMMTLIGLAITVAYSYSLLVTLGMAGEPIYWELATLVTIMLLGHWLEMRAVESAQGALGELASFLPDKAELVQESGVTEVLVEELRPGNLILVRPGGQLPADGEVTEGRSHVDEALLTGESIPVAKGPGDKVIAGSVNGEGSLRVTVEQTGSGTTLAGILSLVEQAQASRSRTQILADRAASWLVLLAVAVAGITAVAWALSDRPSAFVLERVVTVLVASCPHALGLAIPLVVAISTSLAARSGALVKDRLALEEARLINCVVFDKTGTLTLGRQQVSGVHSGPAFDEDEIASLAAAAESDSEHGIARALREYARKRGLEVQASSSFEALAGRGVRALVDAREIHVGGPNLLEEMGISLPRWAQEIHDQVGERGEGLVHLLVEKEYAGAISFSDKVREESYEAVEGLQQAGLRVVMLTGDSPQVAARVSQELGIDSYFAGVLPPDKQVKIEELKAEGYRVAMVGDGVNDAPALAAADVGIAIGAGTDVAVQSSGIVLVRNDPRDVIGLIRLARATYRKMIQNLWWAAGYNVMILPLAAGVLAPIGLIMPMAVGAVVMSASTLVVALNAQLLKREVQLKPSAQPAEVTGGEKGSHHH